MAKIDRPYLQFFQDLEKNNNRDWFKANKARFESAVKEPFTALVEEMIRRISQHEPEIRIGPKEAMFRIYRDVRFSKDKTPYKPFMAAVISKAGRKGASDPGFYFQVGGREVIVAGGAYQVKTEDLYKIRRAIVADLDKFEKLLGQRKFKKLYGTLQGDRHKRLPKEFSESVEQQPLIANKQFYYWAELESKKAIARGLPRLLMDYYSVGKPFNDFFKAALNK